MWNTHLKSIVANKTEISELDSILGKNDDDDMDEESIGKLINKYEFLVGKLCFLETANLVGF